MTKGVGKVVIIGGGVVGLSTAYFLAQKGVTSTVIERDSVASHSSGFAYGGLSSISISPLERSLEMIADDGMDIHRYLGSILEQKTGIATGYRNKPLLSLVFDESDIPPIQEAVEQRQSHPDYTVTLLTPEETRNLEPRVSENVKAAVLIEGSAEVDPLKFNLALAKLSEEMGTTILKGTVTSIAVDNYRVSGVVIDDQILHCDQLVIAMGPWSTWAGEWLGFEVKVTPLKGQIVRLKIPGDPIKYSVGWNGNYASTKPDGLVWAGTTEEWVGFDETPTQSGREDITRSLLKMMPYIEDAQLVQQTACLRPVTPDRLPILGYVPKVEGIFLATGAERKGIVLGPSMGRITADMIINGTSTIPIEPFSPTRFSS
ncbi:MAG: FAD-dependent oxidoreductase [Chloroflexota bacterium]|nr:FAD-dependent oxidoreductase [Chloroflexota bacterium]